MLKLRSEARVLPLYLHRLLGDLLSSIRELTLMQGLNLLVMVANTDLIKVAEMRKHSQTGSPNK